MIKKIEIETFGHLQNKQVSFEKGLNLFYGENETGKSTIQAFIRCMLFGMDNGRKNDVRSSYRKRYVPIDSDYAKGSMEIDEWVIIRKFGKSPKYDTCTVIKDGTVVDIEDIGEQLTGMSADVFENTVFIKNFNAYINVNHDITAKLSNLYQTFDTCLSYDGTIHTLDMWLKKLDNPKSSISKLQELQLTMSENLCKLERAKEQKREKEKECQDLNKEKENEKNLQVKRLNIQNDKQKVIRYEKYCQKELLTNELDQLYVQKQSISDDENSTSSVLMYKILAIIFGIIGLGFLFTYSSPFFMICIISFLPMALCIKHAVIHEQKQQDVKKQQKYKLLLDEMIAEKEVLLKKYEYIEYCVAPQYNIYELESEEQTIQEMILRCSEKIARLSYAQELYDETIIENLLAEKEKLEKDLSEVEFEISSIQIAKDVLEEVQQQFYTDYRPILTTKVSSIFCELSGGRYDGVLFKDGFELEVRKGMEVFPASYLSNAALDMVYFALRLAIIEMVYKKSFLLLDDTFIQYDDKRAECAMDYLKKLGQDRQIIYFTCQSRYKQSIEL